MAGGSELLELARALLEEEEGGRGAERERGGGISGGRLGIGTRTFDAGDGRRVASHAGDDARRTAIGATGRTGLSYRSDRSEYGLLQSYPLKEISSRDLKGELWM